MSGYGYRVTWSYHEAEWIGTCAEFPELSHMAASRSAALAGIRVMAEDAAADLRALIRAEGERLTDLHLRDC